jgi:glucose/arabinose dehydrogenase
MKRIVLRSAVAASLYVALTIAQAQCPSVLVPSYSAPVVASGWQAQLVAGGLTKPRSMVFDSTGALLVVESGKGISRHSFTDHGGTCLVPDHAHMIVEMTTVGFQVTERW